MAAQAMPHCMLRSSETRTRSASTPRSHQGAAAEAHHDLGPAQQREQEPDASNGAPGSSAVTTPTTPLPPRAPRRRREMPTCTPALLPGPKVVVEEDLVR